MAFRTADGRWRAQPRVGGKRLTKTFRTKAMAERWEAEVAVQKENPGLVLRVNQGSDCDSFQLTTFGAFAKRWLEEHCKVEKAASQYVEDGNALRRYLIPRFGTRPLHELTESDLEELKRELRVRLKAKTVNNVLGLAKKVAKTAVKWKVLKASPWATVEALRVGRPAVAYWTPAERDGFLAKAWAVAPDMAALVAVAAHTGLRRGELAGLTWAQVDFGARLLRVDAVYCFKAHRRITRTKGSLDAEYVPLNAAALSALRRLERGGSTAVFDTQLVRHANERLARLCTRLGVKRVRFHDLRHTFGSTLAMAGVELSQRQRLMRHKTVAMTDRYTHLSPDFLRAAVESLTAGTDLAPAPGGGALSTRSSSKTLEPQTGFEAVSGPRIQLVRTPA
jgi:integrase